MSEVTRLLQAIEKGDARATDELLPIVYGELRRLAAARLAHESPGQTLQATALVHEAYLRLIGDDQVRWDGQGHFFASAAEAMRRILIDNARRKKRIKHGGDRKRVDFEKVDLAAVDEDSSEQLLELDKALKKFEEIDETRAQVVKMRYFAGMSNGEVASALGISERTVKRHWMFARAWLKSAMSEDQ